MKETLNGQPTQQEIAGLKPNSNATQTVEIPTVARDKQGIIIWRVKGGTPEDNLRLGINNVRALVIAEVPEIANLPLDENGRIKEEDRKWAESYILEKVRSDKKLKNATARYSRSINYPAEYRRFGRSITYTSSAVFKEYGLFENQGQEFLERRNRSKQPAPSTIILIDRKTNEESTIKPIDNKTGRQKLTKLIKGELKIDDIEPIYVTAFIDQVSNAEFYVCSIGSKIASISINLDAYNTYKEKGALLAVPHREENFGYGYQWIDFHKVEENNVVDLNNKLDSVRFNSDTGKFENKGWEGPERQAFIDYMSGILEIDDPSELPPFINKIEKNKKSIYLGMHQEKLYKVNLSQPLHVSSQEVLIKTKHDPKRKYEWIEGYDMTDTEQSTPLFTRRIIDSETKGEPDQEEDRKGKQLVQWKGPKIQSIIDWAYGRLPIEDVEEAEALLNQDNKQANLFLEGDGLKINLANNKLLDSSKPLYISAKEDDLYKWIEVQQDYNISNERKLIHSFCVECFEGKPKLNGVWPGAEKQALVDYIDGQIDPKYLKSLKIQVGKSRIINIVSFKGKQLEISSDSKLFSPGGTVQIVPKVVTNDSTKEEDLILEVSRENEDMVLKRHKYDRRREQFYVLDDKNEESDTIPLDQPNEKSINRYDFDPSELSPELRQEILDRFAEFLEQNPDTQISVMDFAMEYIQKHSLTL